MESRVVGRTEKSSEAGFSQWSNTQNSPASNTKRRMLMKTLTSVTMGLLFLASSFCYARPPECDPGPHGCDNKSFIPPVLQIYPFKINDKKGAALIVVDKKGEIKTYENPGGSEWQIVGKISTDGRVVDPHGKLLAVLRDNAIWEDSSGTPLVRIDTDGTFDNGSGVSISWTKDGTLKQGDVFLELYLSPANSPARQAASIVLFLRSYFTGPEVTEVPQALNNSVKSVSAGKSLKATKDTSDIPTPLSVCTDRAQQRFSSCISNGQFTRDTCQVFYQQSIDICYNKYK